MLLHAAAIFELLISWISAGASLLLQMLMDSLPRSDSNAMFVKGTVGMEGMCKRRGEDFHSGLRQKEFTPLSVCWGCFIEVN